MSDQSKPFRQGMTLKPGESAQLLISEAQVLEMLYQAQMGNLPALVLTYTNPDGEEFRQEFAFTAGHLMLLLDRIQQAEDGEFGFSLDPRRVE
jgi:hypothetical protein